MNARRMLALPSGGPRPSWRFEWLFVVLSAWFVGGVYLDGWAHAHLANLETFFTPWHAVLYSGYAFTALLLASTTVLNHRRGSPWRQSVPRGYELALAGSGIFMIGGLGDMTWHIVFGIERSIDALLSPTHLILALGGSMIIAGPLRATWRRPPSDAPGGILRRWPMVLSFCYLYSIFTFFTQYASPWYSPIAAAGGLNTYFIGGNDALARGIASILIQAAILMGMVLMALRRSGFPPGALTAIVGLNALGMSVMSNDTPISVAPLVLAAAVAGTAGDVLLLGLRPSPARLHMFRLFAFAFPAIIYAFYFAALQLDGGIWWTVHFWTGSIILAGAVGFLLSWLAVPPPAAEDDEPGVTINKELPSERELEAALR